MSTGQFTNLSPLFRLGTTAIWKHDVRRRLDALGELRSRTGLTPMERLQYQELCAMEKSFLFEDNRGE
jgi:hypothetical protein